METKETSDLGNVVAYLIDSVDNERHSINQIVLLLLVYLCDWHSCVKYGIRFTNVKWYVSKYGLSDDGLESYIRTHPELFRSEDSTQAVVYLSATVPMPSEFESTIIQRVIEIYKLYAQSGLFTFVMSTYPILSSSSEKLEVVDLLGKAQEYNATT
jgi:hypothetical protein